MKTYFYLSLLIVFGIHSNDLMEMANAAESQEKKPLLSSFVHSSAARKIEKLLKYIDDTENAILAGCAQPSSITKSLMYSFLSVATAGVITYNAVYDGSSMVSYIGSVPLFWFNFRAATNAVNASNEENENTEDAKVINTSEV